ncbi:Uncharacterized protein HZ326_3605 [Fusarium oxysporum f. sp. albedinis]|nr:Uncharacterized protein HZ326_3605 [Fusarium oxysporum f. sp. albedinis]
MAISCLMRKFLRYPLTGWARQGVEKDARAHPGVESRLDQTRTWIGIVRSKNYKGVIGLGRPRGWVGKSLKG